MLALLVVVSIGYFSLVTGQGFSQTVSVTNPCYPNPCALNQECIAVSGACMNPPCPLMATCQDTGPDPCASNPCPGGQKCLPDPKRCFMAPCPQYRCSRNEQSCPPNEKINPCGNLCEGTCDNKFPACIAMCAPPACVCVSGYYRQNGICVPETQCRSMMCPPNEKVNQCGNLCEGTCQNKFPACVLMCAPPACVCEQGYYRQNGVCVPETQCKSARNEKPGLCPMFKMDPNTPCRHDCQTDADCAWDGKCCGQCVKMCFRPTPLSRLIRHD